jgi:hypothetical protein
VRLSTQVGWILLGAPRVAIPACRDKTACPKCDTAVIAAISEPASILPPLVDETVGRDIGDQVFERLAVLKPGGAPIDTSAYRPALAERAVAPRSGGSVEPLGMGGDQLLAVRERRVRRAAGRGG